MTEAKIEIEEESEDRTEASSQDVNEIPTEKSTSQKDQEAAPTSLEHMKKTDLIEKVREIQTIADKNYELFLRSQAEMENLKKRFQKEKTELIKFSNESLVKQLLMVIDNLEKAISATSEENPIDALREGVELTLKGLIDTLEKSGLVKIEPQGEPFDPNYHEAMLEQEDSSVAPRTVLQVLQKGYLLNERLVRPAMVVVSRNSENRSS